MQHEHDQGQERTEALLAEKLWRTKIPTNVIQECLKASDCVGPNRTLEENARTDWKLLLYDTKWKSIYTTRTCKSKENGKKNYQESYW